MSEPVIRFTYPPARQAKRKATLHKGERIECAVTLAMLRREKDQTPQVKKFIKWVQQRVMRYDKKPGGL